MVCVLWTYMNTLIALVLQLLIAIQSPNVPDSLRNEAINLANTVLASQSVSTDSFTVPMNEAQNAPVLYGSVDAQIAQPSASLSIDGQTGDSITIPMNACITSFVKTCAIYPISLVTSGVSDCGVTVPGYNGDASDIPNNIAFREPTTTVQIFCKNDQDGTDFNTKSTVLLQK